MTLIALIAVGSPVVITAPKPLAVFDYGAPIRITFSVNDDIRVNVAPTTVEIESYLLAGENIDKTNPGKGYTRQLEAETILDGSQQATIPAQVTDTTVVCTAPLTQFTLAIIVSDGLSYTGLTPVEFNTTSVFVTVNCPSLSKTTTAVPASTGRVPPSTHSGGGVTSPPSTISIVFVVALAVLVFT